MDLMGETEQRKGEVKIAKRIKCPGLFCGSKDCFPITTHQNFKIGRGIMGGVVGAAIHPVGAMVGVATEFNGKKKVKFMCNKCGRIFTVKV